MENITRARQTHSARRPVPSMKKSTRRELWASPTPRHINPLSKTTPVLPLHIHNIGITLTPTPHPILLLLIPRLPILVLFLPLLRILGREFQERRTRELAGRCVGRTVLNRGVAVAEVAEVVDVVDAEEGAGGEGVDRGVSPLFV